jgi:uncharacterized protein YqgC (DUF456 family)
MVELVTVVALALVVLGVVGSVTPFLPGALLSLAGVYLYWWHTGYTDPGLLALAGFTVVGVAAFAFDQLAGLVAAKASGASAWTSIAAGVVGFALFFVAGPLGVLLGVAATVFVLEYFRHADARRGVRTALYTTIGMLGSAVVQVMVTLSMLVAFLLVLWL